MVLALSVVAVGDWVGARVADGVLRGTSGAAALYVTNFVEPHVQSMDGDGSPTPEDARRLDAVSELLKSRRHVASIKIWRPDGTIVYSTQRNLIGKKFPTTDILPSLQGKIRAGMADFDDDDSEFERSLSIPLYEIFLPLYKNETEKIIAVAEIYEDARALLKDQAYAVGGAWLVVGAAGLCTLLVLFAIVYRGSLTIGRHRATIKKKYREKLQLHRNNDLLKSEVEQALRTSARIEDLIHTRVGIELHDGPVQLMSFVLLRLDEVEEELKDRPARTQALVRELRSAVEDALKELRAISAGLFLPDAGDASNAVSVLESIIRTHEGRTNCTVDFQATNVPERLPRDVLRCVARVIQEGLNNAYKHAGVARHTVTLCSHDRTLQLSIRDEGRGMRSERAPSKRGVAALGMVGMASRVKSVGGSFSVKSEEGRGTEIICVIPASFMPDRHGSGCSG